MSDRIRVGLCSITLRALGPSEVIAASVQSGVEAIEWGADGHVAPGDVATAAAVARQCADEGIEIHSYGSYLFVGGIDLDPVDAVFDSATALGASTVRIWTPFGGALNDETIDAIRDVCARAAARDLHIGLEFHPGTLTETAASTSALLAAVDAPNLWTYWQPETGHVNDERCLGELRGVVERLAHLHVFSWGAAGITERLPLAARAHMWGGALAVAATATAWTGPRVAYLEYVADDSLESLARDAASLHSWMPH